MNQFSGSRGRETNARVDVTRSRISNRKIFTAPRVFDFFRESNNGRRRRSNRRPSRHLRSSHHRGRQSVWCGCRRRRPLLEQGELVDPTVAVVVGPAEGRNVGPSGLHALPQGEAAAEEEHQDAHHDSSTQGCRAMEVEDRVLILLVDLLGLGLGDRRGLGAAHGSGSESFSMSI